MSQQVPPVTISKATPQAAGPSASPAEKTATSPSGGSNSSAPTPKLRSCVACRTRKVRCDKLNPCSNCRRANIACVFPSRDRPPRWARRLERVANNAASGAQASSEPDPAAAQVLERLRDLESMVKKLSGQLEQANAAASSAAGGSSGVNSPGSYSFDRDTDYQSASLNTNAGNVQNRFGRLVLQDANRSRYVSSGFWSRVNDELDGLEMDSHEPGASDSDLSEDEISRGKTPSTQELQRRPSERHAFLFRHNLSPSAPDLREFHPLPSQIPFLLDVFLESVNSLIRVVHVPTVTKLVRDLRGSDMTSMTPANEALMFSIYYAAVTAMEEDDIIADFGSTKADLNLKFRLGLEHALARADFLNVPDLVLLQAFVIFLCLVRRHDSPRFVWMMTGLAIRMAQALGLQRDGTHFKHLTPYEIEMRRRVWGMLCMLDVRASEDQGTDYTIARGSYDTKLPLNINDADIDSSSSRMPTAREGITDMTYSLVSFEMSEISKRMMQSGKEGAPSLEEQSRLLSEIYSKLEQGYLQYSTEQGNIAYWVAVSIARLMMAKMTLFIYSPVLFSSPSEHFSDEINTKLLVAALEVAEYNHALNAEQACRHWRWMFQTYTHWYAIVYLLLESSRRPWLPIIERAWVALHSQWLIPAQCHMDKNLRIWIPLRKLTAKARKHRNAELGRLRDDPQAAKQLELEDQKMPVPSSPGPFPAGTNAAELFRERWRQLLAIPEGVQNREQTPEHFRHEVASPSAHSMYTTQPSMGSVAGQNEGDPASIATFEPAYSGANGFEASHNMPSNAFSGFHPAQTTNMPGDFAMEQNVGPSYDAAGTGPSSWSMGTGFVPWLWPGANSSIDDFANVDVDAVDMNMDMDGEVDWYNWVESAKGMEWDVATNSNERD